MWNIKQELTVSPACCIGGALLALTGFALSWPKGGPSYQWLYSFDILGEMATEFKTTTFSCKAAKIKYHAIK